MQSQRLAKRSIRKMYKGRSLPCLNLIPQRYQRLIDAC